MTSLPLRISRGALLLGILVYAASFLVAISHPELGLLVGACSAFAMGLSSAACVIFQFVVPRISNLLERR